MKHILLICGLLAAFVAEAQEFTQEEYAKAKGGDPTAQYNIGMCYHYGTGVETNQVEAFFWFRCAAEQGNADAQYKLGETFFTGKDFVDQDYPTAASWFIKAAHQGHAKAQYAVGVCCECGYGITQDDSLAYAYYSKAAANDEELAEAWTRSGNLLFLGKVGGGNDEDKEKGRSYIRKGAVYGDPEAQYFVSHDYDAATRNVFKIRYWLRKASQGGNEKALAELKAIEQEADAQGMNLTQQVVSTYDEYEPIDSIPGMLKVKLFDYYGIIDLSSREVLPCKYNKIRYKEGTVHCQLDDATDIYTADGKFIKQTDNEDEDGTDGLDGLSLYFLLN